MTRVVTVDLDAPDGATLELLDAELRRRHEIRNSDPELRADLLRLLPMMAAETAQVITEALNEVHPAIVLSEWWDAFYKAVFDGKPQPALGSFPRPDRREVDPEPWNKWLRDDPTRNFVLVVEEMIFIAAMPHPTITATVDMVIAAALHLANRLGLDPEFTDPTILRCLEEKTRP